MNLEQDFTFESLGYMSVLNFYHPFAEMNLFLMWFHVLCCFFIPYSAQENSVQDCFISSGHNSGEEGLGKSINIAVEQNPGEERTYGLQ